MQATDCNYSSQRTEITHPQQILKCKYSIQKAWKRARSLARIKVSAFGAGDRGFKSHRARLIIILFVKPKYIEFISAFSIFAFNNLFYIVYYLLIFGWFVCKPKWMFTICSSSLDFIFTLRTND